MSGLLRLRLLGGFELRSATTGAPIPLPARKPALLLAYLALRPGQPQGRDKLAGLFWGNSGDAQARTSLRQALAVLRRQLGPHAEGLIQAPEVETVALAPGRLATDVAELEACLASGARDALERAVALYEGDLLDGFQAREPLLEEWLVAERQRLREAVLAAMAALLPEVVATGPAEAGVRLALRVLALDPLQEAAHRALMRLQARQEAAHRALMRLQARQGRRGAAPARYQALREALARELGVAPEEETQRLHRELRDRRGGAPDDRASSPPAPTTRVDRPARGPAVPSAVTVAASGGRDETLVAGPGRASVAVMPFVDRSAAAGARGGAADALAHDVITRLAKLRSLFVIAQGTVFALHERRVGPEEAGRTLGVGYVVGGWVRHRGGRLTVSVELTEVPTARISSGRRSSTTGWTTRSSSSTRSATGSSPRSPARSRRSSATGPCCGRRTRWTRGAPTTAACGTCAGSAGPTTSWPGTSSGRRCASTRPSPAPTPACPSRTSRTPSRVGRSAGRRSTGRSRPPGGA